MRPLTGGELAKLKASVAQVRCSGCGAPVNLARDMACSFCRAPLEVLDADAVSKALATLNRAELGRGKVDVAALADTILAGQRSSPHAGVTSTSDLVGAGVALLISALDA